MSHEFSPAARAIAETQSIPPRRGVVTTPHPPLAEAFAHGSLIDGTYRILGDVGQGAMGVVLLARDEQLERNVALKVIRPERLRPGFAERFRQEAKAMARLNHRNIVAIHAFGEHDGLPYFVMELVDGYTLNQWLAARFHDVDLELGVAILNEVCLGVSAIHAAGTVHRDIKPSNILLDRELHARIADFGISTSYGEDGAGRTVFAGTPAYMAPEIAFSEGQVGLITPSADVYSLACVAYQMLTGRLPVDGQSDIELLAKHAVEEVMPPSQLNPKLPPSFDRALLHGLAKNPQDRTESVDAFRTALLDAMSRIYEPRRILVAEDDRDFRDALEVKLHMEFPDTDVVCVGDGNSALAAIDEHEISAAILDLQMPGLGGIPLTAALRARDALAKIPVFVLTAAGGPNEWRLLHHIGADKFLVKPVDLDDVVSMLRRMLRERAQR
ncbi:MAG TPA: protein kinase [Polyangiaceae bacterium]|nr:protein kinase [Polyangiaceae bacterium]